jgi:hypothetical protein
MEIYELLNNNNNNYKDDDYNSMLKIWRDQGPYYISMPNIGKITIQRHDRVCAQLQCTTCKNIGVKLDNEHWYEDVPRLVETSHEGKVTIL